MPSTRRTRPCSLHKYQSIGVRSLWHKQYRASDHTSALQKADEERDKLYASLRDTIKAYAKLLTSII